MKQLLFQYSRQFALVVMAAVIACNATVSALSPIQKQLGDSGVYHFNVEAGGCTTSGGSLVGAAATAQIYNFLAAPGKLTPMQAAGVMGNMSVESGFEPQRLQGTSAGTITPAEKFSGGLGWGLVQWTPGSKFIDANTPKSRANDIGVQLEFLWAQLNGETPIPEKRAGDQLKATTTLLDAVLAFQGNTSVGGNYYGYERPKDQAGSVPERLAAAELIMQEFGGAVGAGGAGASCATGGSAVAGDAVKTAMNYAWPTYHPAPYVTLKPEYAAAVAAAKSRGEYIGGIKYPAVDCGGFLTRVFRDSGVDPTYNWGPDDPREGPTGAQFEYLRSSPKWQNLGVLSDTSQLLPGDVAIRDGHTFMYVGQQPGFGGNSASSSLDERSPMASNAYFSDSGGGYTWFRLKP